MYLALDDPIATAAIYAIRAGDVFKLKDLLTSHHELSTAHIGTSSEGRTLLHILTDYPGHLPSGVATAQTLVAAGADVNATFIGRHTETPLHWAASSDDVPVLDALLDLGADINAPGGVIAGGTPLTDARAFLQLNAAKRLIERGAAVTLQDAATLGLLKQVQEFYGEGSSQSQEETDAALWNACHGGQLGIAGFLKEKGANLNTAVSWDERSPLDVARKNGSKELVIWLEEVGAKGRKT